MFAEFLKTFVALSQNVGVGAEGSGDSGSDGGPHRRELPCDQERDQAAQQHRGGDAADGPIQLCLCDSRAQNFHHVEAVEQRIPEIEGAEPFAAEQRRLLIRGLEFRARGVGFFRASLEEAHPGDRDRDRGQQEYEDEKCQDGNDEHVGSGYWPRITPGNCSAVRLRVCSSNGFRRARRTRAPASATARMSASRGVASRVTTGRFTPCELSSGCGATDNTLSPSIAVRTVVSPRSPRPVTTCTSTFCPLRSIASTPVESVT